MSDDRASRITARVVPQGSRAAGDATVPGTPAERVALVAELTRMAWDLAKLPFPSYSRATMPVVITPLAAQGDEPPLA